MSKMFQGTVTEPVDEFKSMCLNNLEPSNDESKKILQLITDILVYIDPDDLIDECSSLFVWFAEDFQTV